ncbi:hypothetical protein V6N13_045058 [Hibiscus sabdariffa]|uniref:Transmembrane protein n=1 Tax=Hibiscus sabdariffa TaxID=183260 RepID=A0ABR2RK78_9ROSI
MEIINKNQSIIGSHLLKLVTKVLLPFSLLSLILLLSNFRTLAYVLQLFSFSVDKNYMFLLCNGLLVFIATTSGLISWFGVESGIEPDKTPRFCKGGGPTETEVETESSEPKGSILKAKVTAEVDQREDLPLAVQYEEEEEEEDEELVPVEEDEDEELNKKCEDFIRRMKQGIQFEARN